MTHGQYLRQLREAFFRTVFLVSGDEDDPLPFAGAIGSLKGYPLLRVVRGGYSYTCQK
jgi:hypothetical protein